MPIIFLFYLFSLIMATAAEQPCYTLINIPNDSEMPNEVQLRQDLGKEND